LPPTSEPFGLTLGEIVFSTDPLKPSLAMRGNRLLYIVLCVTFSCACSNIDQVDSGGNYSAFASADLNDNFGEVQQR